MLVYLEPNSFGLKSCSSFLSLTDLNKHICYSELDTKLLCVVPEFPRGSSSLPVFVSCQMDLRDPCKAKTPWFPCFCDFCTGLLYLCSSTSASQIYLLLFLKESRLGYLCGNLKIQMMAVMKNLYSFHSQFKTSFKTITKLCILQLSSKLYALIWSA